MRSPARGLRISQVPLEHVIVEMAVAPLAALSGLHEAITVLDPTGLSKGADHPMRKLWRDTEWNVARLVPGVSLDEIVAYRDLLWFATHRNHSHQPISLARYMRRLARSTLRFHEGAARPNLPEWLHGDGSERLLAARRLWLWLQNGLPPDILFAAAYPDHVISQADMDVVVTMIARDLDDLGYGEVHCHLGAAAGFSTYWYWLLKAIGECEVNSYAAVGAVFDNGRQLAPWLLNACLARQLLARFLRARETGFDGSLEQYFEQAQWLSPNLSQRLERVLFNMCHGTVGGAVEFYALRQCYTELCGGSRHTWEQWVCEDGPCDEVALALSPTSRAGSGELAFLGRAQEYLSPAGREDCCPSDSEDHLFTTLFWQYARVRTTFYRHVVQRPHVAGMQWFIRFFGRTRPTRATMPRHLCLHGALEVAGHGKGLRSLEVRCGPPPSESECAAELRGFFEEAERSQLIIEGEPLPARKRRGSTEYGNRSERRRASAERESQGSSAAELPVATDVLAGPPPLREWASRSQRIELGIVYHFVRNRGGGFVSGNPSVCGQGTVGDPDLKGNGQRRFYDFYCHRFQEALAIAKTILHFPASLSLLRAIDVCTDELGVPSWVIRPLFDLVRRASAKAVAELKLRGVERVRGLHATAHAGEDFVHLATGLRHVHEAIEWLANQRGDRLGHAIALGVEVKTWAESAGWCAMSREQRFFDLVWESRLYTRATRNGTGAQLIPPSGRPHLIEQELKLHGEVIFGESADAHVYRKFHRYLYSDAALHSMGFLTPMDGHPSVEQLALADQQEKVQRLYQLYMTDPKVFKRCYEPVTVDPTGDIEALVMLQQWLRDEVANRGVAIEINPTSNLLVGHQGDLAYHPLWRLHPPIPIEGLRPLDVCIGSDDPLVFATSLREEYQRLYDALRAGGLSDAQAWAWLSNARETARRYRFTLDRPMLRPDSVRSHGMHQHLVRYPERLIGWRQPLEP